MKRSGVTVSTLPTIVSGINNLYETPLLMGSSFMNIEKNITLFNDIIEYYEQPNGVQNIISGEILSNISIDAVKIKNTIITTDVDNIAFNINIKNILIEYIYANIKRSRAFNGVTSIDNINELIRDYISKNMLDKYIISEFKFFSTLVDDNKNSISYKYILDESELTVNKQLNNLFLNTTDLSSVRFSIQRDGNKTLLYNFLVKVLYN